MKVMGNIFWPDIQDLEDAKKAARNGAWVCFFIAIVTTGVILLQMSGKVKLFAEIGPAAFVDVALFTFVGIFLLIYSRTAAVIGLVLYIAEQAYMMSQTGFRFNLMVIFFTLALIASVRGTFAYHEIKKTLDESDAQSGPVSLRPNEPQQAPPPKKRMSLLNKIGFTIIAMALIVGVFAGYRMFVDPKSGKKSVSIEDTKPLGTFAADDDPTSAGTPGKKATLKLSNGQTVSGEVLYEDETYYTIKTMTGQEIVLKEDLAK